MGNTGYHMALGLSKLLHLPELVALSGQQLLVLRYTLLHDDYLPYVRPRMAYRTIPSLDADIAYLNKHFVPMDLYELLALRGRRLPNDFPRAMITFDGGLRHSLPLARMLHARSWPAVFFLPVDSIDNRQIQKPELVALILDRLNEYPALQYAALEAASAAQQTEQNIRLQLPHLPLLVLQQVAAAISLDVPAFLADKKPYLSWEEVRQLQQLGIDIGLLLPEDWTANTLAAQLAELHAQLGHATPPVAALGPYTATPTLAQLYQLVRGEQPLLSALFGGRGLRTQHRIVHRLNMDKHLASARQQIKAAYMSAWLRSMVGMNRIKHKT